MIKSHLLNKSNIYHFNLFISSSSSFKLWIFSIFFCSSLNFLNSNSLFEIAISWLILPAWVSNSLKIDEDIDLATIQKIINKKLKVIFTLLKRKLEKNINISDFQSGILITGGLANLISVKEIATDIFQDLPIVLCIPNIIENKFINLQEHNLSCCVGLLNYARFQENKFELDSNKKVVYFNHTKNSDSITKKNKRELPTFMKKLLEHF